MNKIYLNDCLDVFKSLDDSSIDLIACDPPFNINFNYSKYKDDKPYDQYVAWLDKWIKESYRVLNDTGSIFVCMGDEYASETNLALKKAGFTFRNAIIWKYSFGQNQRKKFNRCHTNILYFVKHAKKFKFYPDDIKVPSARQIKYKDKRAKHGGKLPDDVWDIPRICGTFKERLDYSCQMPESIMERIILCSTKPGDLVYDPFSGSGTTAAVAHRLKRNFLTCDIDPKSVEMTAERIFGDKKKYEVLKPKVKVDLYETICPDCQVGKLIETTQFDDMDGILHCEECGKQVQRYLEK